jgi:hypothetical protein
MIANKQSYVILYIVVGEPKNKKQEKTRKPKKTKKIKLILVE